MKTTIELDERDVAEAVGLLLAKRGMRPVGKLTFNVNDGDVGDPRGWSRTVTVSTQAETVTEVRDASNLSDRDNT